MKLQKEIIEDLLFRGDKDFYPHLSTIVDIKEYAEKLYQHADFKLVGSPANILGCIAYYKNYPGKFLYITHFWVNTLCQKKGYGKYLIEKLKQDEGEGFNEICAEVYKIDDEAKRFYENHGFEIKEDRVDRYLLTKVIY